MDRGRPAPILQLFQGYSHVIEVVLAEEIGGTIGTRRPRYRGNSIDDQLEVAFACAESVFSALPVLNIG